MISAIKSFVSDSFTSKIKESLDSAVTSTSTFTSPSLLVHVLSLGPLIPIMELLPTPGE
jgi:hypothetical protein